MRRLLIPVLFTMCAVIDVYAESSVDVAERFALASDREAVVASLVPGTEQYFYYRCLLWQHQGKLADVDALLPRWQQLHGESEKLSRIKLRQAVLLVNKDAAIGIPRLANEVGIEWNAVNEKRNIKDQHPGAPQLPSTVAPELMTWKRLIEHAEINDDISGWSQAGLERRLPDITDGRLRRKALQDITNPLLPGVLEAVIADLAADGGDFGSLPVHTKLTVAQLDAIQAARPTVITDADFMYAAIHRRTGRYQTTALSQDAKLRHKWIDELQKLTVMWPADAQPLRDFLIQQRVADSVASGNVATDDVLKAIIASRGGSSTKQNLPTARRLIDATNLPSINNYSQILNDAILMVLAKADDTKLFTEVMDEDRLRQRFIEAKLLNGIGDPQTWLTRSSDVRFAEQLSKRVDLHIDRSCPQRFAAEDAVMIPIILKNVPELHVRVYALDPENIFRANVQPNLKMDLAGVVPNSERRIKYTQPPIQQHREMLTFKECAGPGWWIIECIGEGQMARTLISKGALSYRTTISPDGELLHVYDETNKAVSRVSVRIGDQEFVSGPDGSVRLPFVNEERSDSVLILGNGRALITKLQRQRETWSLELSAQLNREQLIAGGEATVLVRPALLLNNTLASFKHAQDVSVEIVTTNRTGARQKTVHTPTLDPQKKEWALTFPSAKGLAHISITIRASVHNQAKNNKETLTASFNQTVAPDIKSTGPLDMYLERSQAGWSLACLGLAGEPAAGQHLRVYFKHRYLKNQFHVDLETDPKGRVYLGQIPDVTTVTVYPDMLRTLDSNSLPPRSWQLMEPQTSRDYLTLQAGQELRIPAPWHREQQAIPAWTLRHGWGVLADDVTALLTVNDERGVPVLVGKNLPPGNYELTTPAGTTHIEVIDGTPHGDVVLDPNYISTVDASAILGAAALPHKDGIRIQVVGRTPTTRVHVIGIRFHPQTVSRLSQHVPDQESWSRTWIKTFTHHQQLDPELGYILARAQAPRLPGVMLERPGLLLNPWYDFGAYMGLGAGGGSAGRFGGRSAGGKGRALAKGGGARANGNEFYRYLPDFDFLPSPGVVLTNLIPDDTNAVVLNTAQLGDAREIIVQVCDHTQSTTLFAPTALTTIITRERRLMAGLPPEQHFVVERHGRALNAGDSVNVEQASLSRVRVCATVEDLITMYLTLNQDSGLREFEALGRWSRMSDGERRRWYSEHACHEVHLFLYYKDRAFFDAVVRPYIANKLQPGFIDDWLVERDLSEWLLPDRHSRLNLCERILLARRIGGDRGAQELANIRQLFDEDHDQHTEISALIAQVLVEDNTLGRGVARAPGGGGGFGAAMEAPREEKKEPLEIEFKDEAVANSIVVQQDYRDHKPTQALIEQQWYKIPWYRPDAAELFWPSAFWRDVATWNGQGAFLTPACLLTESVNECLVALALSDLPLTAEPPVWSTVDNKRKIKVTSPTLLLSEELISRDLAPGDVIVHQRYYNLHEWRQSSTATPHTGSFKPGVPYLMVSVAFNPTPSTVSIAALAQIPTGSIPFGNSSHTDRSETLLGPYEHQTIEQIFYFPLTGKFAQFPTHVRAGTTVAAATIPTAIEVAGENLLVQKKDLTPPAALLANLEKVASFDDIDFAELFWHLDDKAFWSQCIALFERRGWYDDGVWELSFKHGDTKRIAAWLRNQATLVDRIGRSITTNWITIDPLATGGVVHSDFSPLTNPRVHSRAGESLIHNDKQRELWHALLDRVALEPEPSARSRLELSYALSLQDRFADAAKEFKLIDRKTIPMQLQYDYLGAWLAFGQGDLKAAASFATAGKDYPVEHWRLRFAEVQAQLDEIAGKTVTRDADLLKAHRQSVQATATPSFQAKLQNGNTITIASSGLKTCSVRWRRLDLEPLFSRAPFAATSAARSTLVQPAVSKDITLAADGTAIVPFPKELQHQAVAVEITAAGQSQVLTSFADALDVRLSPGSGQLQVLHAVTGKPLPATYVKVYVEYGENSVVFHKDGYTDLRGRFDYASRGDGSVGGVKRIALFISHDDAGATIREVSPP